MGLRPWSVDSGYKQGHTHVDVNLSCWEISMGGTFGHLPINVDLPRQVYRKAQTRWHLGNMSRYNNAAAKVHVSMPTTSHDMISLFLASRKFWVGRAPETTKQFEVI